MIVKWIWLETVLLCKLIQNRMFGKRQADGDNQSTFRWRTIVKQTTESYRMQFSIFRKVAWHFYGEKCGAKQARVISEIVKTEQESTLHKIETLSSIVAPPGLVNKFRLICLRYTHRNCDTAEHIPFHRSSHVRIDPIC